MNNGYEKMKKVQCDSSEIVTVVLSGRHEGSRLSPMP